MATSYTTLLGLALPVQGELSGTWGDTVNDYITQYLDAAVAGTQTISGSQTAVTLSKTTNASLSQAGSGATGSSQYQIINCTGNPGGLLTITAPAASKAYLVLNNTSTNQSVKVVGAGPTTGVTVTAGERCLISWNGSDFVKVGGTNGTGEFVTVDTTNLEVTNIKAKDGTASMSIADSTGVASFSANPVLSGGTANGVAYLNASKVLTTGSALRFDGTNFAVGSASAANGRMRYQNATNDAYGEISTVGGADFRIESTYGSTAGYKPLTFYTNGSEQMRLTSTGLGIGTSSPGAKLHLNGAALLQILQNDAAYIQFRNTAGTDKSYIQQSGDDFLINNQSNGVIQLRTNNTIRATLDASGNLGLGVTPSAWSASAKAIQLANTMSRATALATIFGGVSVLNDCYYGTANDFRYFSGGAAARSEINNGAFAWYTAPSGTAGNAISFTQAMTLDASGRLGIGTSSPSAKLQIGTGSATGLVDTVFLGGNSTNTAQFRWLWNHPGAGYLGIGTANDAYGSMIFGQASGVAGAVATEWMRIDSSGNLGLGVTPSAYQSGARAFQNPAGSLYTINNLQQRLSFNAYRASDGNDKYIANGFATEYRQGEGSGIHSWHIAPSGTAGNAISFTQAMTLDASGNFGIGTSSPSVRLHVANSGGDNVSYFERVGGSRVILYNASGDSYFGTTTNTPLRFATNDTERARIDSSGNLLVGTTSTTVTSGNTGVVIFASGRTAVQRNVNGSDSVFQAFGSAGVAYIQGNGNLLNTNNSYGALSDLKLKENITDATPKLSGLMQVRVVNYNLKSQPDQKHLGVIAQELEQVFPGLVEETPDRDADGELTGEVTKSVKYSVFVPMLIKALQEQQAMIQQLQAEVAALKGN